MTESDVSTESCSESNQPIECSSKSDAKSDAESEYETDSSDDGLTTCLQSTFLKHFGSAKTTNSTSSQDNWPTTIAASAAKKDDNKIDTEAIADQVLLLFRTWNMNPNNLTDEQVENLIKYVAKIRADNANHTNGSIETISVSNSSDYSVEL